MNDKDEERKGTVAGSVQLTGGPDKIWLVASKIYNSKRRPCRMPDVDNDKRDCR